MTLIDKVDAAMPLCTSCLVAYAWPRFFFSFLLQEIGQLQLDLRE